jgi:hypothetical protein
VIWRLELRLFREAWSESLFQVRPADWLINRKARFGEPRGMRKQIEGFDSGSE